MSKIAADHRVHLRNILKVRQSQKQIMVSSILPKKERWDNFQYIKFENYPTFVFWEN